MGHEDKDLSGFWCEAMPWPISTLELLTFDHAEPASGTVLGHVVDCDLDDFRHAIEIASTAQAKYYEQTTAAERGAFLRRWSESILANANDREYWNLPCMATLCDRN